MKMDDNYEDRYLNRRQKTVVKALDKIRGVFFGLPNEKQRELFDDYMRVVRAASFFQGLLIDLSDFQSPSRQAPARTSCSQRRALGRPDGLGHQFQAVSEAIQRVRVRLCTLEKSSKAKHSRGRRKVTRRERS